jgi:serine/threonine protein kinase
MIEIGRIIEDPKGISILQLEKYLGRGKAGSVYKARLLKQYGNLPEGHSVALKLYNSEIMQLENQNERIRREAAVASRVNHPNIIQVYGLIDLSLGSGLIMECVEGATLRDKLCSKISAKQAIGWSSQLLDGLSALHEAKILHRDLKPENILVTTDERFLKIGDFGVVKLREASTITESDVFLGTIRYAAPEYLFDGKATIQSDQYSIGTIIYEMLHGQPLISESGTFAAQVVAIEKSQYRQSTRTTNLPVQAAEDILRRYVMLRLLRSQPESRFPETRDAQFLFSDTINSDWWKGRLQRIRDAIKSIPKNEDENWTQSRARVAQLRQSGTYDMAFAEACEIIKAGQHGSDFYCYLCPVCGENTFLERSDRGDGQCLVCHYERREKGGFHELRELCGDDERCAFLIAIEGPLQLKDSENLSALSSDCLHRLIYGWL